MTAYYNEKDRDAAAWLRELIAEGHIAPGVVDERSIVDVRPADLDGFAQCHFFAGISGWSLALRLAGWPDDRHVWTGSCPCQPFSGAGQRKGFDDERHLWPEFKRLIAERRPAIVFGEQVASATDWLRLVRGDLEALEYAVGAMPIEAASAGADHLRDRYWFVAYANDARSQGWPTKPERADQRVAGADGLADADEPFWRIGDEQPAGQQPQSECDPTARDCSHLPYTAGEQVGTSGQPRGHQRLEWTVGADGKARRVKPGVRLLVDGFPHRVGLLRGFGNAIDPRPATAFIKAASDVIAAQ